jgi:integrase
MSVNQRGNGWEAYVTYKGKKFRRTLSTKEDATVLEAMWQREIAQGNMPTKMDVNKETGKASGWSLRQAMDRCHKNYWDGSKNEFQMIYLQNIICKYWGKDSPINRISTTAIFDWITWMKEDRGYAPSTVNRHISCLKKCLDNAVDEGALTSVPKFKRQSEKGRERIEYFSKDEEKAILSEFERLGEDYLRDYAIVAVDTGMRASEVLKVDGDKLIKLQQTRADGSQMYGAYIPDRKNGEPLLMPITKRVEEVLRNRKTFNDPLYKHRLAWDKVRERLGLTNKCWHTWRHTTATRLTEKGYDTANIMRYMGHKNIATTLKYAKWDTSTMVGGSNLLED